MLSETIFPWIFRPFPSNFSPQKINRSNLSMNTSKFQKPNHLSVILKIAVCSRLFLFALIIFWRSLFEPYDTSAPLNPNCLTLESRPAESVLWRGIGSAIEGSIVWDAVYFVRIAQCGYEYEQSYAFLPLLPICVSFLSRTGLILCFSSISIYSCKSLFVQILECKYSWMNYGITDFFSTFTDLISLNFNSNM